MGYIVQNCDQTESNSTKSSRQDIIIFAEEKKGTRKKSNTQDVKQEKSNSALQSTKVVNYTSVTDCSGDSNG